MAASIITLAEVYAWIGLVVALVFLLWGIDRVVPGARGAFAFRPLAIPGVVLLWPLVLWRWWRLEKGGGPWAARHAPPRRLQDGLALGLAVVIPVFILSALLIRQDGPFERPAVQLAAPTSKTEASQ